ncbi:MAG: hypothetical protein GTO40_25695 [Deltaproteobacteria bacterium]|nr:hypothetical protein [Deltaproteobacteria bacterium]
MALVIGEKETRELIDMATALKVVEQMFHDRAVGKVRSLPRRRLRSSNRQLNVMAAWQEDSDLIALRAYMGGANTITLYNGQSGELSLVLNARYLSSLRTGAASGVAVKYLAPKNTQVLGLVGTGKQAVYQLEAIAGVGELQQVLVYGRNAERRKKFFQQMSEVVSVEMKEASSVQEVEQESDIFVLATDATASITDGAHLKDEVLVITMGANATSKHEVSTDLVRRMDTVVTDDLPTAQYCSGDLVDACKLGITRWENVLPLESIVGDSSPATYGKKVLFQSNGIPDEDLAVAGYVWDQVQKKKIKLNTIPGL